MVKNIFFGLIAASMIIQLNGCGYTTRSLLPSNLKTIYIDNFKNSLKLTAEQSNLRMYRGYSPGMERDLTKRVIDKYLFDGNLKVTDEKHADLILRGELIDYQREPLRYDANNNVEEYRIKLVVNISLEDVKNSKVMWTEEGFAGETTYRTGGSLAKTDTSAIQDAIDDLARRIVERTVEAW